MKTKIDRRFRVLLFLGALFFVFAHALGAEKQGSPSQKEESEMKKNSGAARDKMGGPSPGQGDKGKKPIVMPIYKPPLRGAPSGRVGGGTRGGDLRHPSACVIAPDHVGLTVHDQPHFYWFLSEPTQHPIEFTLIENRAVTPRLEMRIENPAQAGIQKISLADFGEVRLKKGFRYEWYVAVILDPDHRSMDIVSGAQVEMVPLSSRLKQKLDGVPGSMLAHVYAEEGLWYDALHSVSAMIEAHPGEASFKQQRASLMEQVGLRWIAQMPPLF